MTWTETYISWRPRVLSVLRIVTGLLFLQYGMAKLLKFPAVPLFKDVTLFSLLGLAGTIELVGGVLVILGLFTRPVAFILAGEMAFAYFLGHAPRGFLPILNGGNLGSSSALYSSTCRSLAAGHGASMPCEQPNKASPSSAADRCPVDLEAEPGREGRAAQAAAARCQGGFPYGSQNRERWSGVDGNSRPARSA